MANEHIPPLCGDECLRATDGPASLGLAGRKPWAPTQEPSKRASTRDTRFSAINRQRRTHQKNTIIMKFDVGKWMHTRSPHTKGRTTRGEPGRWPTRWCKAASRRPSRRPAMNKQLKRHPREETAIKVVLEEANEYVSQTGGSVERSKRSSATCAH